MSDEVAKTATKGNPSKASRAPLLLGLVLLALLGGAGSAWFVLQRGQSAEASRTDIPAAPKYIVHLDGFTVNLADPEETHFLRVTIDLGIDRLPAGVEKEKAAASLPVARTRDAILSVLTTGKADVLLTAEGKAQLKKNLLDSLNRHVPELGVREIYFTEFLVQR